MNGAQYLGGMMGFGRIDPEPNEPPFHAEWEKRALGVTLAVAACGLWNIDKSRHAREALHPVTYLSKSYYEIWIEGLEKLLVTAGLVRREELRRGRCIEPPAPVTHVLKASQVETALDEARLIVARLDRGRASASAIVW